MSTKPAAPASATAAPFGAAAASSATAPAVPAAARSALSAWLPAIATVLLAPVATWAAVEFVLLPRLQKKISAPPAAESGAHGAAVAGAHDDHGGKSGKDKAATSYEFTNLVVNLAGTMGTRYLKTSFIVTGPDGSIRGIFERDKPRLTDVTLNVLSSLTLADLEEPGAKNILRERLVGAYNQTLGRKVAEQVYFSDFVIQ